MKVYFHFLLLLLVSFSLSGCTWNQNIVEYKIESSSWTWNNTTLSGTIALQESESIAYINQFSGSVMLDEWVATRGALIHENSILVTHSGSEVEIIFADNSVVRLSQNSRLQISHKWEDNTSLVLQEWTLWARILKPFTDLSFFTLETDDLSAGVRGTSVWLTVSQKWTEIWVVDSTAPKWKEAGIDIQLRNNIDSGTGKLHLSAEEILSVINSKSIDRKKMSMSEQVKFYPFIGKNMVRDIRYMNAMMQVWASGTTTQTDRVRAEMSVTMPNMSEVTVFVTDTVIRSKLETKRNESLSPDQFIYYLNLDAKIQEIKKSDMRDSDKNKSIEEVRKLFINAPIFSGAITGITIPVVAPIRKVQPVVAPITRIVAPSSVSGEKIIQAKTTTCIPSVSGEWCK